jgi:2-polyprenyl-3-methyl-5-hydroxy-6-metoxy-1,4-benzoquinol methylase
MAIQDYQMKLDISTSGIPHQRPTTTKKGTESIVKKKGKHGKPYFKVCFPPGRLEVLDVGCGTGEMGFLFAELGHRVTGLDLSEKMFEKARDKASRQGHNIVFKKEMLKILLLKPRLLIS